MAVLDKREKIPICCFCFVDIEFLFTNETNISAKDPACNKRHDKFHTKRADVLQYSVLRLGFIFD